MCKIRNNKPLVGALSSVGFEIALENGKSIREENPIFVNKAGDFFKIEKITPSKPKKQKYHNLSVSEYGKVKTIKAHKIMMHTFVGTPNEWLQNKTPEGVPEKEWKNASKEMKKSILKLLAQNAIDIDHINPVSNDSSDKAYRLDNLQYMLSSKNNKKGGN